jgi:hypothetical protein
MRRGYISWKTAVTQLKISKGEEEQNSNNGNADEILIGRPELVLDKGHVSHY